MLFGQQGRERRRFQLFNSSSFGENDLLFRDVTDKLAVVPDDMDVSQVLGLDYVALLKGLGHEGDYIHICSLLTTDFSCELIEPVCVCEQGARWRTVLYGGAVSAMQSRRNVSSGPSVLSQTRWCA